MRILSAEVRGFQSFEDSGKVDFLEGINLIIGQNNSGKSSLLRALLPVLPDDAHRNPDRWEGFKLRKPETNLTLAASGAEISSWFLRSRSAQFLPVPADRQEGEQRTFAHKIFESAAVVLPITRTAGMNSFNPVGYPSHGLFDYVARPGNPQRCVVVTPDNGELKLGGISHDGRDSLPALASLA